MTARARKASSAPASLSTGEVAARLGVTEQRVQTVLRTTPALRPPLAGGKRRWSPEHVRALEARLAELA